MKYAQRLSLALLLFACTRASAQTITWDGGGDGTSWTDPANWNPNRIPNATDDVLLDAGAGVTVTFNVPWNQTFQVGRLQCLSPLQVLSGTLSLEHGSSAITAPLTLAGGVLRTLSANAALVIQGPLTNTYGWLVAQGGSVEVLGPCEFQGQGVLVAQGTAGSLSLPSVTSLNMPAGQYLQVQAYAGGRVSLPALQQSSGRLLLYADGPGSTLDLSALAGHWSAGAGSFGLQAEAYNQAQILIPQVTSMGRGTLTVQNGGVSTTAQFTGLGEVNLTVANASLNLSNLTQLVFSNSVSWSVSGTGQALDLSGLTNLTLDGVSTRLAAEVSAGARLDLGRLEQITGAATLRTHNAGTVLDLRRLRGSWSGAGYPGGIVLEARTGSSLLLPELEELAFAQVTAHGGATLDLASLREAGAVSLTALGAALRLPSLTSVEVSPAYSPEWLASQPGGLLDLSRLTNLVIPVGANLQVQAASGGVVDLSGLPHWQGRGVWVARDQGALLVPQLTTLEHGQLQLENGGTITTAQFTSLGAVNLTLVNASLTLSNLQNLTLSNTVNWSLHGAGQVLDLSGLTNLSVVGASRRLTLTVQGGARADLSALRSATGGLSILTYQPGSVADLSRLGAVWSGAGASGGVLAEAQSGSTLLLSQLEELDQGQLVARSGASLVANQLRRADAASFTAANATLRLTNLTSLVVSNFFPVWRAEGAGALLDLSGLTNLTVAQGYSVQAQAVVGGRVDLSRLSSLFTGAVQAQSVGTGSVLDFSSLSGFVNLYGSPNSLLQAQDGGVILLPQDAMLLANVRLEINGHPILLPLVTASSALTLYGQPWHSYQVERQPTGGGAVWQLWRRVPATNALTALAPVVPSGWQFRVMEFVADPPILELNRTSSGQVQLTLFGAPTMTCEIESGSELTPGAAWEPGATVEMTNSFRILPPLLPTEAYRFQRAREVGPEVGQ